MSQSNPSDKEANDYAQEWILNGNDQSKAWRVAFPKSKASDKAIWENASTLHKNPKVQQRILELSNISTQKANEVYGITAESLLAEYEECRVAAIEEGQVSAAVSSINGKVKLCGFDVQKIDHTSSDGSMTPSRIELVAPSVNKED